MAELPLTNGGFTLVDDDDFAILAKYKWKRSNHGYAIHRYCRETSAKTMLLHRMITCPPKDMQVDHINGNKLDNRRENLRLATAAQNARNSKLSRSNKTGFKGTRFLARTGRFSAQIRIAGTTKHLGYFDTAEEAHAAYCKEALAVSGEFARFK